MYGGSNSSGSNSMLYGGPLGTYLSGIYQPINSINKSNAPKINRRSSVRSGTNNLSSPSTSSLYYTPQPRRRTEEPSKYSSSSNNTSSSYVPSSDSSSSSLRTRPRSFYTPSSVSPSKQLPSSSSSTTQPTTSSYSRPSSVLLRPHSSTTSTNDRSPSIKHSNSNNSITTSSSLSSSLLHNDENKQPVDYKKLYEDELSQTTKLKEEINEVEIELEKIKSLIDKKKHTLEENNKINEINFTQEMELKELEQLKGEGDKLKAENRALSRVVARLSREK